MPQLTNTMVFSGPVSQMWTTPYPHKPGERGRDRDGNEYVFCAALQVLYYGQLVLLDSQYQVTRLLGTAQIPGRVGVWMGGTATTPSGQHAEIGSGGWVQVYGLNVDCQTGSTSSGYTSDQTVNYWAIPQTSVGTPSGVMSLIAQGAGTSIAQASVDGNVIYGMWVVPGSEVSAFAVSPYNSAASTSDVSGPTSVNSQATSGPTSAFIGSVAIVFLNYPYVTGIVQPLSDATS